MEPRKRHRFIILKPHQSKGSGVLETWLAGMGFVEMTSTPLILLVVNSAMS